MDRFFSSSARTFCIGCSSGSFQFQTSTLIGASASSGGSGFGVGAVPSKSAEPSSAKVSRPFSLALHPAGRPLVDGVTSAAAAVSAARQ